MSETVKQWRAGECLIAVEGDGLRGHTHIKHQLDVIRDHDADLTIILIINENLHGDDLDWAVELIHATGNLVDDVQQRATPTFPVEPPDKYLNAVMDTTRIRIKELAPIQPKRPMRVFSNPGTLIDRFSAQCQIVRRRAGDSGSAAICLRENSDQKRRDEFLELENQARSEGCDISLVALLGKRAPTQTLHKACGGVPVVQVGGYLELMYRIS